MSPMSSAVDADDFRARVAGLAAGAAGDVTDPRGDPRALLGRIRGNLETASRLADRMRTIPDDTRLRGVKQAVASGLRPITAPQADYNAAILESVLILGETLDEVLHERETIRSLTEAVRDLGTSVDRFAELAVRADEAALARFDAGDTTGDEPTLEYLLERIHALRHQLDEAIGHPTAEDAAGDDLRARVAVLRARQNLLVRAHADRGVDDDHGTRVSNATFDRLYEHFEDRFRGSRDFVTEMLQVHVATITATDATGPVIDVGCGRGEWLELLAANGVEAYGLDANSIAVARCRERGLDARDDDVIGHLTSLEPGSVRAITAFHVVEHLPFDDTVGFLDAALVALAPGGALILETPNPTNLTVGGSFFWIDPTHIRPMHPELLEFLVTERGFIDATVEWLHPRDDLRRGHADLVTPPATPDDTAAADTAGRSEAAVERINDWIFGHLDYAIVARKSPAAGPVTS